MSGFIILFTFDPYEIFSLPILTVHSITRHVNKQNQTSSVGSMFGIRKIFKNRIIRYSVFGPYSLFGPTLAHINIGDILTNDNLQKWPILYIISNAITDTHIQDILYGYKCNL